MSSALTPRTSISPGGSVARPCIARAKVASVIRRSSSPEWGRLHAPTHPMVGRTRRNVSPCTPRARLRIAPGSAFGGSAFSRIPSFPA
eukprot:6810194-Pyramimonas_sp.AAC.1